MYPPNSIQHVRDIFRFYNNNELSSERKRPIVEEVKGEICYRIAKNPDKKNQIINTYKLAIKIIQEQINNRGIREFKDHNYYGNIDDELFNILINSSNDEHRNIQFICAHLNTPLKNQKLSFWRTNYTSAANELRDFLKSDEAIENAIQDRRSLLQRPFDDEIENWIINHKNNENLNKSNPESNKRKIVSCQNAIINGTNYKCKVQEYRHEQSTYDLAKIDKNKNPFLYKGHVYEVLDVKGKKIYTGPLTYNSSKNCVEPANVFSGKVVFNLGTSITDKQDESTIVRVFKKINLTNEQKVIINGPGSDLSNPITGLAGQVGGYGISNNVGKGLKFIKNTKFIFNAGFSRGAITTTLQVNQAQKNSPETNVHIFELDPVAGGGFDVYHRFGNPTEGLAQQAKSLNNENIVGGTVLYSKEVTPGFNPTIYKGNNYGTFVVDTNHQNIDGVDASQFKIPGVTKLKREHNLKASDVVQSMLEKQLLLYGIGIIEPAYFSDKKDYNLLNEDLNNPRLQEIIRTPVIPGTSGIGNNRYVLLQGIQNLRDALGELTQLPQDDEYKE